QQDEKHDQQLDADQKHADAHTGLERNCINRVGLASETGKRGARVGECIYANAEPGDAVAARNADQTEQQNHRQCQIDWLPGHRPQNSEVGDDDDRNEDPQDHDELALRDEISLAGLVNQFRDFLHRAMNRQVLQLNENYQSEHQAEKTEDQPDEQELVTIDAQESDL